MNDSIQIIGFACDGINGTPEYEFMRSASEWCCITHLSASVVVVSKVCYNFDQVEGEGADEQIQGLEATRCEAIGSAKRCGALFG
jgi:hypothetical protein